MSVRTYRQISGFVLVTARRSNVYKLFGQPPLTALREFCNSSGMTIIITSKVLQNLVEIGIVRELTALPRNPIFIYKAYINILREHGEPLRW